LIHKYSWKKLYLKELLHVDEIQQLIEGAREVVISRNNKGFYLKPQDRKYIAWGLRDSGLLSKNFNNAFLLTIFSVDDQTSLNELPHSLRSLTLVVNVVKIGQDVHNIYKDLEIVSLPNDVVQWSIIEHRLFGYEWIEEAHRTWKAETTLRASERLHTELNQRKRKLLIDIGPKEGLQLSEQGISFLARETNCKDIQTLLKIPRDHPKLIEMFLKLKEKAGDHLALVSIPIETNWFILSKLGVEHVSESYRRWPAPSRLDMEDLPNCKLVHQNRIVSAQLSRQEWESLVAANNKNENAMMPTSESEFSELTGEIELSWN
jgi:hypothetical protein